jgi:outer membrane receptor for ferrienterochelin and colicin
MGITANLLDGKINLRAVRNSSKSVGLHHSHGFGAAGTSPTSFTTLALDALVNAGLIAEAEAEPRRSTANGIIFDRASEGYETTLTANPTKNWRLQANYSYTQRGGKHRPGTEGLQRWVVIPGSS